MENDDMDQEETKRPKIYFNPMAFTIEENNEFLRRGYEPWFPGWSSPPE